MTDLVTPPAVTTLPPGPVRGQTGFSAAVALFLEALPDWGGEVDAAGAATYQNALAVLEIALALEAAASVAAEGTTLFAFSTSTLSVGAGTKVIHFTAPATGFAVNDRVYAILRSDPTIRMVGSVSVFDGSDDMSLLVTSSGVVGSGSYSSWLILHAGFFGSGATAAALLAGTSDAESVTPATVAAARAPVTLDYGATVTVDLNEGANFVLTATGNFAIEFSNLQAGKSGVITIRQDATGSRLWTPDGDIEFPGGTPALSTAANAVDTFAYYVEDDGSPAVVRGVLAKAYA